MKRLIFLFFAITALAHGAHAQFKYWKQLSGPPGGYVFSTAIDSTQRVLIGTGAGGIYTSSNNGDTWIPLNKGLRTLRIRRVEGGPAQYIYMFDLNYHFARFRDLDQGWEFSIPWENQALAVLIHDLHVTKTDVLYLSGHRQGIRRSTDNGATWHWPQWFTEDSTRKKLSFRRIAATVSGDTLYAITDSGYVYRAMGSGDVWEKADGQLPNWKVMTESFEVSRGGDLIVGTQRDTLSGKIYRSTNGGANWDFVFEFQQPSDHVVYALVRSSANGDLYASTHSPPDSKEQTFIGGIYYSTDNGATWVLRDDAEHGDDKFSMTVNREGRIFHGSVPGGVEMSTDSGFTWADKNDGLYAQFLLGTAVSSKGDLFATTPFTTYRSTTGGAQWQELRTEQIESFHEPIIRMLPGDILYLGTFFGLYRSADNGDHWTRVLEGDSTDPNNYFYEVQQSPSGWIYAASVKTGLMVSKDNGFNWEKVPNLDPNLRVTSFTFAGPDSVLITMENSVCLLSTNGGINWLPRENFLAAAKLLFHHNGTFVALQSHSVRKSTDGGNNWGEEIFPTPELKAAKEYWDLFSMLMDRNNNILIGSDSGVWMAAPPYTEWVQRGYGMTSPDYRLDHYAIASQIVQHPVTGVLYASTRGQSMFASVNPDLGVKLPASVALTSGQNYPNPFSGETVVEISTTSGGYAEFEVYTALGERIAYEKRGQVAAGLQTIRVDGSMLSSGSYLYILRLDGKPVARGWMQIVQ